MKNFITTLKDIWKIEELKNKIETYLNNKKIGLTDTTIFDKAAPYANILTAGEVNDFYKWKMWEDFTESEFKQWSEVWKINPKKRIIESFCSRPNFSLASVFEMMAPKLSYKG